MKSKYVMISGFAFSEESDMEKLRNYAREGWILEDIVAGLFYKLKRDEPKDIVYSLDYQSEANEEYFNLFIESGWKPVISVGNEMHIFSAQAGSNPIYSDCQSEIEKYIRMKRQAKKGTLYSLIVAVALIALLVISVITIRPIFLIVFGLLMLDIFVFIFNFMPYIAYNSRIKQIRKNGRCSLNNGLWKVNVFSGSVFLILGIENLIEKKYFSIFYIILGTFFIISSLNSYKKEKKCS
ncbi:DUF2812 domain-containing protein [Clostridium sp.]|uniref:DUF2812 domain-containing protein n=1 Tax=Clostridium sp. TaxID=1506 RepID=UPI0032163FAF